MVREIENIETSEEGRRKVRILRERVVIVLRTRMAYWAAVAGFVCLSACPRQ